MKRRGASSSSTDNQNASEEPKKDLRSRGLCLVPISCTLQVGSDNGADYWAPALGSAGFHWANEITPRGIPALEKNDITSRAVSLLRKQQIEFPRLIAHDAIQSSSFKTLLENLRLASDEYAFGVSSFDALSDDMTKWSIYVLALGNCLFSFTG
jgi:hypothetical protein